MSLWEEVKSNLVELYSTTTEKTSEIAKVSSRKWDKVGLSREVERQFSELGNLVYTGIKADKENILDDPDISGLITRIEELEKDLKNKDEEINNIRKEYSERKKAEAEASGAPVADNIITDPVLEPGSEESAILVGNENIEEAIVVEPEVEEVPKTENGTKIDD